MFAKPGKEARALQFKHTILPSPTHPATTNSKDVGVQAWRSQEAEGSQEKGLKDVFHKSRFGSVMGTESRLGEESEWRRGENETYTLLPIHSL